MNQDWTRGVVERLGPDGEPPDRRLKTVEGESMLKVKVFTADTKDGLEHSVNRFLQKENIKWAKMTQSESLLYNGIDQRLEGRITLTIMYDDEPDVDETKQEETSGEPKGGTE